MEEPKFKVGQKVKIVGVENYTLGKIGTVVYYDAPFYGVRFDGGNTWYLTEDKLGSPIEDDEKIYREVYKNIKDPKTLDNIQEGDVLINKYGEEVTILGVCDKAIFSTYADVENSIGYYHTKEFFKEYGYTIKGVTEAPVEELTLEEVCKELGRTIKIKE